MVFRINRESHIEIGIYKKNQMEIIELKLTILEIKNSLNGLNSTLKMSK